MDKKTLEILIGDDLFADPLASTNIEKIYFKQLKNNLPHLDVKITEAVSPGRVIKEVNKGIYDIIVTDLDYGTTGRVGTEGYQILDVIKSIDFQKRPLVILCTSQDSQEEEIDRRIKLREINFYAGRGKDNKFEDLVDYITKKYEDKQNLKGITKMDKFKIIDVTGGLTENPEENWIFKKSYETRNGYDKRNFYNNRNYNLENISIEICSFNGFDELKYAGLVVCHSNTAGMRISKSLMGSKTYILKYGWAPVGKLDLSKPHNLSEYGFSFDAPHEDNSALRQFLQDPNILNGMLVGDLEKIIFGVENINAGVDNKILVTNYLREVYKKRKS